MRAGRPGERDDPREGPVRDRERRPLRDRERRVREEPELDRERPVRDREEPVRDREGRPPRRGRRVTAPLAAKLAARYVEEMTGKEPEGITSLERDDDGLWHIGVEVLELHRVPDTTDILALYEAELDEDGELIAYRRTHRYSRAQVLEE
ncbi:gas vesicle protein [Actinomadura alba]|uniref:Gas vesicle protein n=1 Tax=Actinomadura alba TaxID=406431 RepID=A0ABR7LXG1_9ACTN|nr:gas vesicle protein [Actinomadura alba]MBC6469546.1 gas vesicle protein [Actinomadura alba]